MEIERYIDSKGTIWFRIKFMDTAMTEVIVPEKEFEKRYGKFN